jgi:cell division protein FtsQ
MPQTIRRGGKGVRRVAAQRGAKAKVQTARKQTGSAIGHVMRVQPFSEETLHKIMLTAILGTAAVAVPMARVSMSSAWKCAACAG